jgi:hypothetical protein
VSTAFFWFRMGSEIYCVIFEVPMMVHIHITVCWQVTYIPTTTASEPATSIFKVKNNGRKIYPESKGSRFLRVAARRSHYLFVSLNKVTYQRLVVSQPVNF